MNSIQKRNDKKTDVTKTIHHQSTTIQKKHLNNTTIFIEELEPQSAEIRQFKIKNPIKIKNMVEHVCQPNCLLTDVRDLSYYSILAKPLLCGWERQLNKPDVGIKATKLVTYRAPCGRRLRNIVELHKYLRMTNATFNVEHFTFNRNIECLKEYFEKKNRVIKYDISDGKENIAIPLINCFDSSVPTNFIYITKCEIRNKYDDDKYKTNKVPLDLDSNFLCGCDCTDDCLDKVKCQCWQLTVDGETLLYPNVSTDEIGYVFKRLLKPVISGIYECNQHCKCKKNCLNRVVQHPGETKMQVFRTSSRGWGVRCLNDIPKGTYICTYVGILLDEKTSLVINNAYGGDYFGELNYIELLETAKVDYEKNVLLHNDNNNKKNNKKHKSNTKNKLMSLKNNGLKSSQRRRAGRMNNNNDNNRTNEKIYKPMRKLFGNKELPYVIDSKEFGNISRFFNHSCASNLFVQNIFYDTHDIRFPTVALFTNKNVYAGTELTWDYNYVTGSSPGHVLYCECSAEKCRRQLL